MADLYVDPAAGGANDGTSWTDAYVSINSAFGVVNAGDTVHCRGTQTLTTILYLNRAATQGSYAQWIGYNAAGVEDGTKFVLDGNSAAANCVHFQGSADFHYFRNFEFKNATGNGTTATFNANANKFKNCCWKDNGAYGCNALGNYWTFKGCTFSGNTSYGVYCASGDQYSFEYCLFEGNGSYGVYSPNKQVHCYRDVFHNNTGGGWRIAAIDAPTLVIGNVFDGETDGVTNNCLNPVFIGNRFTNCVDGLASVNGKNGVKCANTWGSSNTNDENIGTTVLFDFGENTTGAEDGYTDLAGDDFTMVAGATGSSVAVTIGADGEATLSYESGGMIPAAGASGGGGGTRSMAGELLGIKRAAY